LGTINREKIIIKDGTPLIASRGCGIVHYNNHEPKAAHNYARNSMRHCGAHGAKHIIMWCPSCTEHYDDVVTKEQGVPFTYEHYTAFVARHLDRFHFAKRIEKRVALHYHTATRNRTLTGQTRVAFCVRSPGLSTLKFPTPPLWDGIVPRNTFSRVGQAAWKDYIARIMQAAADAHVDILATIYHSCHREICQEEANYPFSIVN
jgi:hypothetical protein